MPSGASAAAHACTCSSDSNKFDLRPGTVYFNNPGHIKHFVLQEMQELYLLTLSESFLKQNVHAAIFEEFPFLLAESVPPKVLSPRTGQRTDVRCAEPGSRPYFQSDAAHGSKLADKRSTSSFRMKRP